MNKIPAARLVAEARSWLGTPYCHQGSLKGVGCDCLGLVRGLWRSLEGHEAEPTPAYSSSWSLPTKDEALLHAARRHFISLPNLQIPLGAVLLFRMRPNRSANHLGVVSANDKFIHAYDGNCVIESHLTNFWKSRVIATFQFPQMHMET